ncbi:hypothetical protein LZT27_21815 [Aeromonas veronii]|uniref:hypothetical protein n=1 Tax=Aeromonas veronii TaxID=654 RepID=UPI00236336AF|nr:hypothetical protein [Aeromonas veronii]MDD1847207.1 hypothetical protein [Aeromonas veronii]
MKKIFACTLIALGCMAGTAQASTEVNFLGAVNAKTCDLAPEFGGAVDATVQLGTVAAGETGTAVDFVLKPNGDTTDCAALTNANVASVAWGGGEFTSVGLRNVSGNAADAHMLLKHKNAIEGANTPITSSKLLTTIKGDTLNAGGFQYSAQLVGGADVGTFVASAAYVVAYQ